MKELEYTAQSVPKGKRFCTICGEVKRLRYFDGESTHCHACCEKMRHTRLNAKCIPVVLVLLAVTAVSVFLSWYTVPYCMDLFRADAMRRDSLMSDACGAYSDVIREASDLNARILARGETDETGSVPAPTKIFFEAGTRTWVLYLDAYASMYSEYEAANLAESSLDKRTIASISMISRFNEVKQAYEESLAFAEETADKRAAETDKDKQYEAIIADLTAYADASDSRFVKGYVEYYKGRAAQYFKKDDSSVSIAFYEKMLEYLPNEFMTAYSSEAEAAITAGDYEAAIEAYEKLLERNRNYTSVYPAIAEAAFLGGNEEKLAATLARYAEDDPVRLKMEMRFALRGDDLDEAAKVRARADQTIKIEADQIFNKMLADQTIDADSQAVLMNYLNYALENAAYALVKGDKDEAFDIAYNEIFNDVYYYAYITGDSTGFTQQILNMATLCASLVKDDDALRTIKDVGFCDTTTQQVIDGELTVREVFVEGKAQII